MKTILLSIAILAQFYLVAQAETPSVGGCGKSSPSYCVNNKVYFNNHPGYIAGYSDDGTYTITYKAGIYEYTDSKIPVSDIYLAEDTKCGRSSPKICVSEDPVYFKGKLGRVVGASSNGTYAVFFTSGVYTYVESKVPVEQIFIGKEGKCGISSPRFCNGETVIFSNHKAKIVGVSSNGTYTVKFTIGAYEYIEYGRHPKDLVKIRTSSSNLLSCEGVSADLSDSATDVMNSFMALAKVTTSERSEFLTETTKYLGTINQPDSTLFARLVFAKIVSSSTAKVVKDSFAAAVEQDRKELEKTGWKSIDQIEAKNSTLDFATRILAASVKLRMSMPDANQSLLSFRSRLAAVVAETKLSVKITTLQAIVKDMQPMLNELMNDPRHQALGEVTQDVAGWVLKN